MVRVIAVFCLDQGQTLRACNMSCLPGSLRHRGWEHNLSDILSYSLLLESWTSGELKELG